MTGEKLSRFAPALIILLVIAFFAKLAFSNLVIASGDILLFFFPYWTSAINASQTGTIPFWNDSLFMGAPLLANSQVGFFYPLNWPLWLLLSAPSAISATIILHLIVAGFGAYTVGRYCFRLSTIASLLAGVLFALGGYLTSQVEHVNQLQGLAWMPWYFVVSCHWSRAKTTYKTVASHAAIFAVLIALQLLSGHLQTTFISMFALLIWSATDSLIDVGRLAHEDSSWRSKIGSVFQKLIRNLAPILIGAFIALLIGSIQLIPALELATQSTRQGGLTAREALSFSFHPLLLTKSLLPVYEEPIFSEYVAALPAAALILAIIGVVFGRRDRGVWLAISITLFGFLLALGAFNPIYHLLVRLPIFNYFRVPARWLALYALGMALLAGIGLQKLVEITTGNGEFKEKSGFRKSLIFGVGLISILLVWGAISVVLSSIVPSGQEITVQLPVTVSWLGWIVELLVVSVLLWFAVHRRSRGTLALVTVSILVILFLGTRRLPYNDPTTPEAFTDLRPPITRLLVSDPCDQVQNCSLPQGRLLSMSEIFFDVGDQQEINTIYENQIPESAQYDYTVAMKHKEVLSPNLPMAYGLTTVDGFDGGLLPLKNYSEVTKLLLPDDLSTSDGRLREFMDAVPEDRWLDLFNIRFLITDKVGDLWQDEVFFDRQLPVTLSKNGEPVSIAHLPLFEATEVRLLSHDSPGSIRVETEEGQSWLIEPNRIDGELYTYSWPDLAVASSILLLPCDSPSRSDQKCDQTWQADAVSLVNGMDGSFYPLVAGQYRLIHSGDVKIYENLDVLPRAFLVNEWKYALDEADSLASMEDPDFDPKNQAILIGAGEDRKNPGAPGEASIREYKPGHISIDLSSQYESLLILTDSIYPGWSAAINGEEAEILQTDILFRGIVVPPGSHEVILEYKPASFQIGVLLTIAGLLGLITLGSIALFKRED
jgi:hypothetical protein